MRAAADGEDRDACELPADTIAAIALASAHQPCGYAAFSTLHPAYTRPLALRTAAPTWYLLYGT